MRVFIPLLCALFWPAIAASEHASECVIFLHGLARTSNSMDKMTTAFEQQGYTIVNAGYPSRKFPIEQLAPAAVDSALAECGGGNTVHFVTHSLGGILVRYYLEHNRIPELGRVVMLAPPNQGSQVVDRYRNVPGFKLLNGPAGLQLGTGGDGIPSKLGPVDFELGVIAGTRTVNPILSLALPNPDDGKVSVENARVDGMAEFLTVPHSHPFIMRASAVIEQVLSFIGSGKFQETAR